MTRLPGKFGKARPLISFSVMNTRSTGKSRDGAMDAINQLGARRLQAIKARIGREIQAMALEGDLGRDSFRLLRTSGASPCFQRSEELCVGKECRSRWS